MKIDTYIIKKGELFCTWNAEGMIGVIIQANIINWLLKAEVKFSQERGYLHRFKILINYKGKIITVGNPGGYHLNQVTKVITANNETK